LQANNQLECRHTADLFCISDFWPKQRSVAGLLGRVTGTQKWNSTLREEPLHSQQSIDSSQLDEDIFGSSEMLLPALVHVPNLAASDCTVLITGETGTGAELLAKAIHSLSRRSLLAFVRVNCAAIPPQLIGSEPFAGRQKGSGSQATQPRPDRFQPAKGGTILLEGLGDLSAEAQLALLRVLQELESQPTGCDDSIRSDVRLIATTNRDLRAAVADGTFRSDLFDRLNGFPIKIPPLRERKQDIAVLARYFLNRYARRADKTLPSLTKSAMDLLQSYPWPGNVRELQRVMERFASLCEAESVSVGGKCIPRESISARTSVRPASGELVPSEKELLEDALMKMLAELPGWESGVFWE
jgi:transcriptional regulator with GAF, ATPase, and Fis domain